ncbi:MAG: MFS transporter [Aestuariivirgaceae bacterium]
MAPLRSFTDRAIVFLALGETLVWAGLFYLFPALLVQWEEALGWSKAELTGAVTLALLLSALASPYARRMIDAGKGAQLMAGCAGIGGLSLFALSAVTALWQFYLAWAVIGIATAGCLYEPCFAIVTRARGASAKQGIIAITLIAGFASAISFPLAHILSENFDWRFAVQVFAVIVTFAGAPLLWAGVRQVERGRPVASTESLEKTVPRYAFLNRSSFWFLALAFAFAALLHRATVHHLLPILYDRGVSSQMAIAAASFIGPMQVAGRLLVMASDRHMSNHGVAIACFSLMGVSIVLLFASGLGLGILIGFVVLFGGAYGTASIVRPLIARDVLGEANFGAKTGALALLFLAGSALAPYLGSLVWSAGGYDLVLSCLIILSVVGLILYLVAHRHSQQPARADQ